MKLTNEAKVGGLLVGTALIALVFGWIIGFDNPFRKAVSLYITYNFAGGIEVGSPVRVSGIKVGQVEEIDFFVPKNEVVSLQEPGSPNFEGQALTPVRLRISMLKKAAIGVKTDSRFYVNLAGIIGERYIEVTPGSHSAEKVQTGEIYAGVDPPRIDQLISQSFDLAGKMTELLNENKGDVAKTIENLYKLSANLNKTLGWIDKSKMFKTDMQKLINNLIGITTDVKSLTDRINSEDGKKTIALLHKLLWRLEPMDSKAIRKFFQDEGIRTQIF